MNLRQLFGESACSSRRPAFHGTGGRSFRPTPRTYGQRRDYPLLRDHGFAISVRPPGATSTPAGHELLREDNRPMRVSQRLGITASA